MIFLQGCGTTETTYAPSNFDGNDKSKSGFQEYLDENCPNLTENTAKGLDCYGNPLSDKGGGGVADFGVDEYQAGLEDACEILFSISPDGNLFAGENRIQENDCYDWGGNFDPRDADFYSEGYYDTVEYMFDGTPYWCWGDECLTPYDF